MNYFDKIENYLNQTLSPPEMQDFKNELAKNKALVQAVKIHQAEQEVIQLLTEKKLHQKMQEEWNIGAEINSPVALQSSPRQPLFYSLLVACLALLLTFFIGQYLTYPYTSEGLYNTYYDAPDGNTIRGKDLKNEVKKNNSNINSFTKEVLQYNKAHDFIAQDEFETALKILNPLLNSQDKELAQQAEWLQALIHLKLGQRTIAKKQLLLIGNNDNHNFQPKAAAILQKMDSAWSFFIKNTDD